MIRHFRTLGLCDWNGNGFGPHDPGRRREETDKPPDGFDQQYPIKAQWPCTGILEGPHEANLLLQQVKALLPFSFRYETDNPKGAWRAGSHKYNGRTINVPAPDMSASDLIAAIAQQLGPMWQATRFPSHVILYEEQKDYIFGEVLRYL